MTEVPEAFADIMRQHWKSVWSFVYTIVRQQEVADDLAQETFIRAYQNWEEFRGDSSVKTWLFTIAKHAATDYQRSAAVRRMIPFANTPRPTDGQGQTDGRRQSPAAETIVLDMESVHDIWRTVLGLRKTEREVIILRVREDLTFRAVSQVLGISEGNARVLYHRAIKRLKAELQGEVFADEL